MTPFEVMDQMRAVGIDAPDGQLDLTGKIVRFGPKKRHWYSLREMRLDPQPGMPERYVVVGSFGDWAGQKHKVEIDWKGLSDEQRQAAEQERQAAAQRKALERQVLAAQASMGAADLWASASKTGRSEYLERKLVDAEGCRFLRDGSIIIPLLNYSLPREQALRGLQRIFGDGSKRFTKGFDKIGACLRLGLVGEGDPILVCEGYATGLTLRMAVGRRLAVYVALDCGNILPVVQMLRNKHPRARILICADDDVWTPGNPGREKAHKAAKAVANVQYVYPYFRRRAHKETDFNDLHARDGLNVVRLQLQHVLPLLQQHIDQEDRNAA